MKRCIVVFLVFVGLTAVVVKLTSFGRVQVSPEPPSLSYLEPIALLNVGQGASYEHIIDRPLFWASRTPYVPPEEPQAEPVNTQQNNALEKVEVLGLWSASEESSVIIKVDGNVSRLALNDVFRGWRLVEVTSDQAKFVLEQSVKGQNNVKNIKFNQRAPLPSEWLNSNSRFSEIE